MGQKKFSKEIRKYLEIMKMKIQQTIIYGTEWRHCQEGVYNCKRIDLKKKKKSRNEQHDFNPQRTRKTRTE